MTPRCRILGAELSREEVLKMWSTRCDVRYRSVDARVSWWQNLAEYDAAVLVAGRVLYGTQTICQDSVPYVIAYARVPGIIELPARARKFRQTIADSDNCMDSDPAQGSRFRRHTHGQLCRECSVLRGSGITYSSCSRNDKSLSVTLFHRESLGGLYLVQKNAVTGLCRGCNIKELFLGCQTQVK